MRDGRPIDYVQIRDRTAVDGRYPSINADQLSVIEEGDSRQDGRVTDHDSLRAISRQQGIQLIFAGRLNLGRRPRHEGLAVAGRQRLRQPAVPERPLVIIDDRCRVGGCAPSARRRRGH